MRDMTFHHLADAQFVSDGAEIGGFSLASITLIERLLAFPSFLPLLPLPPKTRTLRF